ncbi:Uncharacterized protein T4E_8230 [Trichinella pseudospiralis]|uniref:Metallo-beta-lactamase domain-containing protein n=1 Tax=Trichinella pseudospiralis TaxID=6337 RepID=A0A0V0YF72_TRIPS|nr:Uncharacterized protein T4E_8230 [Trichinella pseudospiralis]
MMGYIQLNNLKLSLGQKPLHHHTRRKKSHSACYKRKSYFDSSSNCCLPTVAETEAKVSQMHHCLTQRFIFNLVVFCCCSLYWYASAQSSAIFINIHHLESSIILPRSGSNTRNLIRAFMQLSSTTVQPTIATPSQTLNNTVIMISDNNSATQFQTQSTTSLTTSNKTIIVIASSQDAFPTLPLPEKHFKTVYSPLPNYTEYAAGPMVIPITIGNITIKSPLYQLFSTVVLVKDNQDNSCNILVDTGIAIDRNILISNLAIHGIHPNNIHYVILTHGHPDHTGNQNLFTQAKVLFGRLGMQGHTFIEYRDGVNGPGEYVRLCKHCKLYPTPGHTASDLTLVVENVHGYGTVAIAAKPISVPMQSGHVFPLFHKRSKKAVEPFSASVTSFSQDTADRSKLTTKFVAKPAATSPRSSARCIPQKRPLIKFIN